MATHKVKFQSVTLEVQPWRHPSGRDYWRAYYHHPVSGKRLAITRSELKEAKNAALEKAIELAKGCVDFSKLPTETLQRVKRMLDVDPRLEMVDEFLLWHSKRKPTKLLAEARVEFLAAKAANKGRSSYNVENLTRHLAKLPEMNLADIRPDDLPDIPGKARTRSNVISAWITFFRWCVKRQYLPHGEPTAPERLDRPIIARSVPATWTPDELGTLLANISPQYLPWLVLGAFAGTRTEEVHPDPKSDKDGIRWEDFQWDRSVLIIRPEVAKTGHRRVIPILPALRAVLWPVRGSGRVGGSLPPHTPGHSSIAPKPPVQRKNGKGMTKGRKGYAGIPAETTRLGVFVGGWKRNALRHSFISYRAALVGLAQAAMEAGNSESEARASYNSAKSKQEANDWFDVR